jgi:hypothetical protein
MQHAHRPTDPKQPKYSLSRDGFILFHSDSDDENTVTSPVSFSNLYYDRMNEIFQALETSGVEMPLSTMRLSFGKEMADIVKLRTPIKRLQVSMSMDGVSLACYGFSMLVFLV